MKNKLIIILITTLLISVFTYSCNSNTTEPQPGPLALQITPTHVSMYGGSDGSVDLTVSGGSAPFQYQWSNGETTEDLSGLTAGVYSVTVTDALSESISDSATVTQPDEPDNTVTDIDGNIYRTVTIGDQVWMAENLKTTRFNNGEEILHITDDVAWGNLSTPGYCFYNNDPININGNGALYNWYAVVDGRNIAPEGWHVPTDQEWQTLIDYLGGDLVAGGSLKETGTIHWENPNTGATNESGFSALPGGYRKFINGYFYGMDSDAWFLSATESDGDRVWVRTLYNNGSEVVRLNYYKRDGFSVRCIRD